MFRIDSQNHPKSVEALQALRLAAASKQNWVATAAKVVKAAVVLAVLYVFEKIVPLKFRSFEKPELVSKKIEVPPASPKIDVPPASPKKEEEVLPLNPVDALVNKVKSIQPGNAIVAVIDDKRLDGKVDPKVLNEQIENDVNNFQKKDQILKEVCELVESEQLFANDEDNKPLYVKAAASTYASTYSHYGPVVLEWMHAQLEKAADTNSQLVFMARDGLAPYKVAKMLKAKYPEKYGSVEISVLYFSRAVTLDWSPKENNLELARKYAAQQGIKKDKNAIFVDVGYEGSMIDRVKEIMSPICTVEFSYLISFNAEKAKGFIIETPYEKTKGEASGFKSIPHRAAGQNPATYWLEDTHVGVLNTSDRLIVDKDNRVRPGAKVGVPGKSNIKEPVIAANGKYVKSTCKETNPKSYLYKRIGFKAILDYAREHVEEKTPYLNGAPAQVNRTMSDTRKAAFDTFMQEYFVGNPVFGTDKKPATRYSLAFHV